MYTRLQNFFKLARALEWRRRRVANRILSYLPAVQPLLTI